MREVMAYAIMKYFANVQSEVKCATHARRHFTCRRHTSRTEGVLIVPLGTLSSTKQKRLGVASLFVWWERTDSPKGPRVKNSSPNCFCRLRTAHPVLISSPQPKIKRAPTIRWYSSNLVGEDGFEPSKRSATDLQSAPFGHSGTLPYLILLDAQKMELVDGLEPPTC